MKGYWLILGTEILDQSAQDEYVRLWKPIAEKYQAKVKPDSTRSLLMEARDTRRVVVVEFPSYDAAKTCYDDPAYQLALSHALQASNRELLILQGDIA
ncbi:MULTISPECIES: DUF1330 domain-containing protein [Mesorhizobium]|uniref:DUF1330 domain-containing protein n=1 Tax=Mesorhizobium denitrificans TaxID=2294114 RepID=A0A371XFF6_9HYPH|nr:MULTISPECIES: DUF1330 domain-containing protein [Mesorhizobium]RFC67975.1 DUF1330 domain-containing protein [Mesorhizobium denitrificans]